MNDASTPFKTINNIIDFFASTVIFPQKILFSYLHFHRIVLIYFM